jgi:hypothetical protein
VEAQEGQGVRVELVTFTLKVLRLVHGVGCPLLN